MTRDESYAMLRVPPSLRAAIEPIVREQNRSWSQQARHVLERYAASKTIEQRAKQHTNQK